MQQESELVVAILRTVLIILAVLAPISISGTAFSPQLAMQVTISAAIIYNASIIILYWRHIRLRGQREVMVLVDILLVTVWIFFTWGTGPDASGSPLFPAYFLIILTSALWFGVSGVLAVAALISVLYLFITFQITGNDPYTLIDALYRQIIYLFLVAIAAGYFVDTHRREREQWTRSQVLLAQYQERFRAAQEVYELLIPSHTPQIAGLDLASRWRPALQEGGGDFYDVVKPVPDRVAITIADVSGKHSRGAIKLPIFKAAFLATSQVWDDPADVLTHVNRIVYPLLQPDMFISACVVVIDFTRQRLIFANAGQDPPIFIRERTRDIVPFETGGLLLGIDEHTTYQSEEIALEPGDTLCLYTDGITEARNPDGDEFGVENLQARVQSAVAVGLPAEGTAENIFDAVAQHVHGGARHDDMTLLVVRYQPEEHKESMA
ncbi:MAG TPA: PP2C family protein-serine/threonine phosphatase [Armatimonadota bacterium]|nr:PP2C family protein-serine/threonine phosphatase [Armatimonadota bacterium]